MSREVRVGAGTDPIAGELIGAMVAEVEAMYGSAVAARPEDLAPPAGAYVTLWEDGRAVAGDGSGERARRPAPAGGYAAARPGCAEGGRVLLAQGC